MRLMKLAELVKKYEETLPRTSPQKVQDCVNSYRKEVADLAIEEDEILEALVRMRDSRDWHNAMLLLWAAEVRLSDRYRSVLCATLDLKDPGFPNEYAVEVLAPIVDPSCLPVLTSLVNHEFASDPDRQIAIKAMDAIADIEDPSATAFLEQLKDSEDPRLAEEAAYLLDDQ
jgi:hypothetical protein